MSNILEKGVWIGYSIQREVVTYKVSLVKDGKIIAQSFRQLISPDDLGCLYVAAAMQLDSTSIVYLDITGYPLKESK